MKVAVLDIGNTHTRLGIFNDGKLLSIRFFETSSLTGQSFPEGIPIYASTVVPEMKQKLSRFSQLRFLSLDEMPDLPVDFSKVDTSTTGADRIANAIAAAKFYELPAMVLDCGTAVSIEVVDENRCFCGGAIAPGRRLMRKALHVGTAQLPEIVLHSSIPREIGTDTASTIAFGVDAGAAGMVMELVKRINAQFSCKSLIGTGGDIDFFLPYLPGFVKAPYDFTLQGILAAFLYKKQ